MITCTELIPPMYSLASNHSVALCMRLLKSLPGILKALLAMQYNLMCISKVYRLIAYAHSLLAFCFAHVVLSQLVSTGALAEHVLIILSYNTIACI